MSDFLNKILSVFVLVHCAASISFGQEAAISVKQIKDYGNVGSAHVLKGEFVLRNTSDKCVPFRIVSPSCNCLTVTCSSEEVPAHGSSKIKFTYSVDVGRGYFDKMITVIPSGSKKPLVLHIRGSSSSTKSVGTKKKVSQ